MTMKKTLLLLCAAALFCAPSAGAIDFGVDLRIKAGADIPAPIIVADPPLFLVPPTLGFQVAVGVPYDMFCIDGFFYLHKGGAWHVAPGYNGPWKIIEHRHLPPGLAKRRLGDMLALRDAEYGNYRKNKNQYGGKSYRPKKEKGGGNGNGKGKGKGNG
jgi:hypothetical protein